MRAEYAMGVCEALNALLVISSSSKSSRDTVFYCCCCEMTLAEKLPFRLVLGAYISYQVVNPCH